METLSVERFPWRKCKVLKTQVRVFFNDFYYFFASILVVPMVLEELILWKTDMLA